MQGLYIGTLEAARNVKSLRRHGITHVLTLGCGMDLPDSDQVKDRMVIQVEDVRSEQNELAKHLMQCTEFIDRGA